MDDVVDLIKVVVNFYDELDVDDSEGKAVPI